MKHTSIHTHFALVMLATSALAQVPQLISYQGRVAVNNVNFDGTGQFKFAMVNAAGTTVYWSNSADTAPADGVPDNAVGLSVSKGLYSVLLGDATLPNMTVVPNTVFNNGDVHLRVWFNDGVNGFQLLTPDQRIAAVGYAIMAATVPDGSITTPKIANGSVTGAKIDSTQVQRRVTGTSPAGHFITGINSDGSVITAAPSGVSGAEASLHIVRGSWTSSNTITAGSGFSVTGNGSSQWNITFPEGTFSGIPTIVAIIAHPNVSGISASEKGLSVQNVTATGCSVYAKQLTTSASYQTGLSFIAVGPK